MFGAVVAAPEVAHPRWFPAIALAEREGGLPTQCQSSGRDLRQPGMVRVTGTFVPGRGQCVHDQSLEVGRRAHPRAARRERGLSGR